MREECRRCCAGRVPVPRGLPRGSRCSVSNSSLRPSMVEVTARGWRVSTTASICARRSSAACLSWPSCCRGTRWGRRVSASDRALAACGQVGEVAAVGAGGRWRRRRSWPLRTVEERLDRVDQVSPWRRAVRRQVEVVEVPVVGLAGRPGRAASIGVVQLRDERVLRAADGGLELVELRLELVRAVAGQFQRVFGAVAVVEEVGAELPEGGDLALVEGLLRGDDGVLVCFWCYAGRLRPRCA
jgi:hypothetical protein